MQIERNIFRKYDIRGIADRDIQDQIAFAIGFIYAKKVIASGANHIAIGRDGRLSSPRIFQSLIAGLQTHSNLTIYNLGLCTTPLLSFAALKIDHCQHGIMITASHNPKEYNGFKFVWQGGIYQHTPELYNDILAEKDAIVAAFQNQKVNSQIIDYDIMNQYFAEIAKSIDIQNFDLHIVVDGSHGPAGAIAEIVLTKLGFRVTTINCEVDGNFPNHSADTTIESNYQQLQQTVKNSNADLGVIFDGDGDRFAIVDAKGDIVWPEQLLILMAEAVLKRWQGGKIVFDVKCTDFLAKLITELGGDPIMVKTGRAHIYKMMLKHQAKLAGEYSGHFFYLDNWLGTDDALYALLRLIQSNEEIKLSLAQRIKKLPKQYASREYLYQMDDAIKPKYIEHCLANVDQLNAVSINKTDGMRISYEKGWALLRSSNTTPTVTMRFEAEDKDNLQLIQQKTLDFAKKMASQMQLEIIEFNH